MSLMSTNRLEYATFMVIGLSFLWPWNCFLSAQPYFFARLDGSPVLQRTISSCLMIISTITATTIYITLVFKKQRGKKGKEVNYAPRIIYGEAIIVGIFLILAFSCLWFVKSLRGVGYFMFLLVSIFISTIGTSLSQNGAFSIVGLFGPIYTQAIMVGQAVAGILPPIVSICTTWSSVSKNSAFPSVTKLSTGASSSRFIYFFVASGISCVALVLFRVVLKKEGGETTLLHENEEDAVQRADGYESLPYNPEMDENGDAIISSPFELFNKLRVPVITVFLVFSVTLSYPVFSQLVVPYHSTKSSALFDLKLFIPFAIFVWNLGDLSGRLVCGNPNNIVSKDSTFLKYAFGRFLFLLAYLLLTNVNNKHAGFNPLVGDVFYVLLHFLFGFTNGHLGSSAMMSTSNYVDVHEREQAGSCMTLVLSLGLTAGSLFSLILVNCLSN